MYYDFGLDKPLSNHGFLQPVRSVLLSCRPEFPMSDDIRTLLVDLLESNSFRQIFPFAVLFFVPLLVLLVATAPRPSSVFYSIAMVLESLGISLPWLWSSNGSGRHSSHGSGSGRHHHEKKKSKKPTGRSSKTERISSNDAGGTGG